MSSDECVDCVDACQFHKRNFFIFNSISVIIIETHIQPDVWNFEWDKNCLKPVAPAFMNSFMK